MEDKSSVCADDIARDFLLAQSRCDEVKTILQDLLEDEHPDPIVKVLEVKQKFENGGFSLADSIRCTPAKLTITFRRKDSVAEQSVDVDGSELVRLGDSAYLKDLCKKLRGL